MIKTQEQNVPKLRFSGFEAVLESVKLGDVATFSKGKGISKSDIDPDGDQPCIRYGELYTVYDTIIDQPISKTSIPASNLKLSKGDEVLVPASGEDAKDIATAVVVKQAGVALGGDLNIIRSKNDGAFLASYLSGRKRMTLAAMAQGNSVVHLYPAQLKTLNLYLPTLPEQRKIASFLGAVDEKTAQLSRKKSLLEDYKKACMQQLFSQKIRFKNDNGNDFPDWEEKRLGWVFEERKTYMSKGHDLPHVSLTVKGVVPKSERYERDFLVRQEDKQYKITYENDICYNPANLKFGVICRNKFGSGIFSPIYCTFEVAKEYDPRFVEALITSADFIKRIRRYEEGTVYERMAVKPADFILGIEKFPHLAEQRKIADFLSALDHKIELVAQELTLARSFKAGLLQQMFI
jgi:type I restriction enzyme S subunit